MMRQVSLGDELYRRRSSAELFYVLQRLVLAAHGDPVPVCIVRPSGIGALAGEPCPGYIGNPSGMTAFILAGAAGECPTALLLGILPLL